MKLYLGLIHYTDGIEGTRRRIAATRRIVSEFGLTTERATAPIQR